MHTSAFLICYDELMFRMSKESLADFPPVPLTLEGSSVLHQFFRFDWKAWRACADGERKSMVAEFTGPLQEAGAH